MSSIKLVARRSDGKQKNVNPLRILEINATCTIFIDGVPWQCMGEMPGTGWEIRTKDRPHRRVILTREKYQALVQSDRLELVDEIQSYAEYHSYTALQHFVANTRLIWMYTIIDAIQAEEISAHVTEGKLRTLIANKLAGVVEKVRDYCETQEFDYAEERKKSNFGSSTNKAESGDFDSDRVRPCPRTLKDLYNRYMAEEQDYYRVLIPKWGGHSDGGRKIDPVTWNFIQQHIEKYCSEKQPTIDGICDKINAHIVLANAALGSENQIPLATQYGCGKAIEQLPYAVVFGGRNGKKQLIQAIRHVGKGHKYKRVGELSLSDCWTAHMFTLLNEEAQKLFTQGEKATRLALAFVMEGSSGVITAVVHGPVENSDLARRAFRMSLTDKTDIAKAAGCRQRWDMRNGQEEAKSDSGRAYRNNMYLGTAYSLVDRVSFTAAGQARLRGKIERILRTIDTKFITSCTGRTGSNVKDRPSEERDAQDRASLFVAEFMKLIIRFIVDVYHNTPVGRGLSPMRQYEENCHFQPKRPPSDDEMRVAYGLVVQRRLTRAGLRFMNIIYWCPWLDTLIQGSGKREYFVKVDPLDLENISVLVGNDWTTIPGPTAFRGVSLDEWHKTQATLARTHGELKRLDFKEFVAPALVDIDRATAAAEAFFELKAVHWTASMMDEIQKDLRVLVVYDRDGEDEEVALTRDSTQLGTVYTRAATKTEAAPEAQPPVIDVRPTLYPAPTEPAANATTTTPDVDDAPMSRIHNRKKK